MSEARRVALSVAKRQISEKSDAQKRWSKIRLAVRVAGKFRVASGHRLATESDVTERLLECDEKGEDEDEKEAVTDLKLFIDRMKDSPINSVLIVTVPIGIFAAKAGWAPWMVFWLNFCALIPLSAFLGMATEDISSYTSEIIAGLLNATFGNVVEMLVVVMALLHHDVIVVQSTLLGSILSNLLFVLGSCFIYGGLKQKELTFSSKAASTCTSLLLLASIALVLPTAMDAVVKGMGDSDNDTNDFILPVSRYTSIIILGIYLQFLYFQLVTHKDYFDSSEEGDDDDDEPKWSWWFAILVLTLSTLVTAYTADYLVDSIHGYAADMNLSKSFIGLILVASVGNIPEFYVTLMMASNDKLDLALSIAVGSSCQMALLVTPFAVLVGWIMGVPMSLNFHTLQIICLLLAVLTVSSVIQGGSATWLHGSLLVGSYIIIAMMFFFLPSDLHS